MLLLVPVKLSVFLKIDRCVILKDNVSRLSTGVMIKLVFHASNYDNYISVVQL